MYLTQCKIQYLAFVLNVLARYSYENSRRHLTSVKRVLCYLCGPINMRLFYSKSTTNDELVGHEDVGYMFDPYKIRSEQVMYCAIMVHPPLDALQNKL